MAKFDIEQVRSHIRRNHPGCPEFAVEFFAAEVTSKRWRGCNIGKAVGITMQNFLRHHMTDYDQMILVGVDREVARRRVQSKVNKMIDAWRIRTG